MKQWISYEHSHIVDPVGLSGGLALVGLSGGLALFWKGFYDAEVLNADSRIIDVKVTLSVIVFFFSFVYGEPVTYLRQEVWDQITEIGVGRDSAWFVVGDLNELMDNSEKIEGPLRPEVSFFPFRNMVSNCWLKEIPSSANRFSWVVKGIRLGYNVDWIEHLEMQSGSIYFPRFILSIWSA